MPGKGVSLQHTFCLPACCASQLPPAQHPTARGPKGMAGRWCAHAAACVGCEQCVHVHGAIWPRFITSGAFKAAWWGRVWEKAMIHATPGRASQTWVSPRQHRPPNSLQPPLVTQLMSGMRPWHACMGDGWFRPRACIDPTNSAIAHACTPHAHCCPCPAAPVDKSCKGWRGHTALRRQPQRRAYAAHDTCASTLPSPPPSVPHAQRHHTARRYRTCQRKAGRHLQAWRCHEADPAHEPPPGV